MSNSQGPGNGSRPSSSSLGTQRASQFVPIHHPRKASSDNGEDTKTLQSLEKQQLVAHGESEQTTATPSVAGEQAVPFPIFPLQSSSSKETTTESSESKVVREEALSQTEIYPKPQQTQRHSSPPSSHPIIGVHRSLSSKDTSCAQSPKPEKPGVSGHEKELKELSEFPLETADIKDSALSREILSALTSQPFTAKMDSETSLRPSAEVGAKSKALLPDTEGVTTFPSPESDSDSYGEKESEDVCFPADHEMLPGYEQVSKTILRKADTGVKSSTEQGVKGKTMKSDIIPESEGVQSTQSAVPEKVRIDSGQEVSTSEDVHRVIKKRKSDTVTKQGKEARHTECGAGASHTIEERLTNTVIRRHVKGKPPPSAEQKNRSISVSGNEVSVASAEKSERTVSTSSAMDSEEMSDARLEQQKRLDDHRVASRDADDQSSALSIQQGLSEGKEWSDPTEKTIQQTMPGKLEVSSAPIVEVLAGSSEKAETKTPFAEKHGPVKKAKEDPAAAAPPSSKLKDPSPTEISSVSVSSITVAKGASKQDPHKSSEVSTTPKTTKRSFLWCKSKASAQTKPVAKAKEEGDQTEMQHLSEEENHQTENEGMNGNEFNELPHHKHNRSCCFCWCCCCSCSCLSVMHNKKNEELKRQKKISDYLENYFIGEEQIPTPEEIRDWGVSFDKLMKSNVGRKLFREFLQCEYSEENILFWLACEEFKTETRPEAIQEKARLIYEDFISILSPREVSLDSRVRDVINKNMMNPTTSTFDEAQLQIYTLMHRDSYPRFVNSPIYRKLAQLASSRRGSLD